MADFGFIEGKTVSTAMYLPIQQPMKSAWGGRSAISKCVSEGIAERQPPWKSHGTIVHFVCRRRHASAQRGTIMRRVDFYRKWRGDDIVSSHTGDE